MNCGSVTLFPRNLQEARREPLEVQLRWVDLGSDPRVPVQRIHQRERARWRRLAHFPSMPGDPANRSPRDVALTFANQPSLLSLGLSMGPHRAGSGCTAKRPHLADPAVRSL